MSTSGGMTYGNEGGVNYAQVDPIKVAAMQRARSTANNMTRHGWTEMEWSRGESTYLLYHAKTGIVLGFTIEGLGTKNLIAEDADLRRACGNRTFYDAIGYCNAAMSFNDVITLGPKPLVFAVHPAIGDGAHLAGQDGIDLIEGTARAAEDAGAVYGPGETPVLPGIIPPGTMCLSGAAIGFAQTLNAVINPCNLQSGQHIVLVGSSGIHANGLSLARRIKEKLPEGYLTLIDGAQTYGAALLTPTQLYVEFMARAQEQMFIAYTVNITGHGWAKLMRAPQDLTYVIKKIPKPQSVFAFIQEHGSVTTRHMYNTFNMGAGFALFVRGQDVPKLEQIGRELRLPVLDAGVIEQGKRQVVIEPINETYTELDLR